MWHMPGHIYSRLKRYPDAVWQQEASARTDHAQMMRDQLLPDQIHNFAHNNEWLIRNLIFIGRIHDALDLAKNMISLPRHPKYNTMAKSGSSTAYGRRRLVQVLREGELWQEMIELSATPTLEPTDRPTEQLNRLRLLGRAHLRSGDQDQGLEVLAELESLLCEEFAKREDAVRQVKGSPEYKRKSDRDRRKMVDAKRRPFNSRIKQIDRSLNHLYGLLAAQSGSHQRAIELLKAAGDMDRHFVASLHIKAGAPLEAVQLVADHVKSHQNEVLPLANQASILWQVGRKDEARDVMKQLREISAYVDLDLPAMRRLAPIVADMQWPQDWRVAATTADDVGDRPQLDSLGPFRWQPTLAKDWTLPDAHDESISLADFRGKPVVVIFYLGFGCLHCAEQLQAFGPHADDFRAAGIELVAVSSDDTEGLKVSVENYDGKAIPFPLVADNDLSVFRQYRVYDDFEQQPLHGTFLIDEQGRIRWHDISYEPFMDHEFVLREAKRLLGQDTPPSAALAQGRRP
jgi:peroxiredoxin